MRDSHYYYISNIRQLAGTTWRVGSLGAALPTPLLSPLHRELGGVGPDGALVRHLQHGDGNTHGGVYVVFFFFLTIFC